MHLPLKYVQLYATCKISYFSETLLRLVLSVKPRGAAGVKAQSEHFHTGVSGERYL